MTYKNVLKDYSPIEESNFYLKYNINGLNYIIYKPSDFSCLELCSFRDISPLELAIYINNLDVDMNDSDEFQLEHQATKEKVIQYLFDIHKINDDKSYESYISIFGGYLMNKDKETGNLFQINDDGVNLLFDNSYTYQVIEKNQDNSVSICFNPITYKKLLNNESTGTIYLFGNASSLLLSKIDRNKKITIEVENDYFSSIYAYIYFLNHNSNKKIDIFTDNRQIGILFSEEYELEDIINIISDCEKNLRSYVLNDEIKTCFTLKRINNSFSVVFRNAPLIMKAFLSGFSNIDKEIRVILNN